MNTLHIGSLLFPHQAIDTIGPLDILGSASRQVAAMLKPYGPVDEATIQSTTDVQFHQISTSRDPVPLTAGLVVLPTCTVDDAPELDILLLGGPDPATFELDARFATFIRRHVAAGKLLFTNCTGAYVAALAGVLDGRRATVNNVHYEWARARFPRVRWTRETKWVVDGSIWTAAGAVAGMDMVSHWLGETYGYGVLRLAAMGLDFEPRDVYGSMNVIPRRYDAAGRQLFTHEFDYYESYL